MYQIYNKHLLSNLIKKADEFQGTRVISVNIRLSPKRVEGCTGYIFKKKYLDEITFYPHPQECLFVDDPWISSYFIDKGLQLTGLFDINVYNISLSETPKNIVEFL